MKLDFPSICLPVFHARVVPSSHAAMTPEDGEHQASSACVTESCSGVIELLRSSIVQMCGDGLAENRAP